MLTLDALEVVVRVWGYSERHIYDPIYTSYDRPADIPYVHRPNLTQARARGLAAINADSLGLRAKIVGSMNYRQNNINRVLRGRVRHDAKLVAHLQQHASRYYPELASSRLAVQLVSHISNPNSRADVYEFCLSSWSVQRRVIVKVQSSLKVATRDEGSFANVSRLLGPVDPRMRTLYEFTAMSSLMDMLDGQLGEQFGGVRIFEMLADPPAVIMKKRPEEDLRRLLALARAGSDESSAQVFLAMRNAGALLRRFHRLPDLPHTKFRGAGGDELIDSLLRLTEYLRERVGHKPF